MLKQLQQKHKRFYYRNYSVSKQRDVLIFKYDFAIEPDIYFSPEMEIRGIDHIRLHKAEMGVLNNLAFHLGLIEIPSYWKATCSPTISIQTGVLDKFQTSWWQDLFFKGLGEFFYKNNIAPFAPEFVCSENEKKHEFYKDELGDGFLVPIGGGKDSAVTCELLKKSDYKVVSWSLNPTKAITNQIKTSNTVGNIIVKRTIDKRLLFLNKKGYLNGHTPFSAYLAFASSACAILSGNRNVAISNERSSNESNLCFNDVDVNHQYSKSFDFEKNFRIYSTKYLAQTINYFSILRPLYEIQISKLFLHYPQHLVSFRSCNRGMVTNSWCHKCPKCLFVFTILFSFIEVDSLITEIFKSNLFEDTGLIDIAFSFIEPDVVKPFECVGTREESIVAFHLSIKKVIKSGNELPIVLKSVFDKKLQHEQNLDERALKIMQSWNDQHFVPDNIVKIIRDSISV